MKKAKIITVHIQKGGAGKTTTTSFLGGELAARGFKVLLLDTDKQKNLTVNYRLKFEEDNPEKKKKNVYNFIVNSKKKDFDPFDYIIPTEFENIDMVPAVSDQPSISKELDGTNLGRLEFVKSALQGLHNAYDFIIIDCGLDLDVLSYNCYQASDFIIVPVNPEPNTKECIPPTYAFLEENMEHNPNLKAGVVFVNVDARESISRTTIASVAEGMKDLCKIFDIQIRRDTNVKQAQDYRVPINLFAPKSKAAIDVSMLIDELLLELREVCPEKMGV
ncbi:ParA family protein [Lysinibacillus pakistanensis]|uniref:ParA family protein n=1 Tax=Lysinibacillus pakistanensis TaxID=759811 RepID=UPI003D2A5572